MHAFTFDHVSDDGLIAGLAALVASDRGRAGRPASSSVSTQIVTGPSLTSETSMCAPHRPVANAVPERRSSSTKRS